MAPASMPTTPRYAADAGHDDVACAGTPRLLATHHCAELVRRPGDQGIRPRKIASTQRCWQRAAPQPASQIEVASKILGHSSIATQRRLRRTQDRGCLIERHLLVGRTVVLRSRAVVVVVDAWAGGWI
jgi:hypothetical protein